MGPALRTCTFAIGEDVLLLTVLPGVDVTASDAREIVATAKRVTEGRKVPLLVDMRRMRSLQRGAREHFTGEEATRSFTRIALLSDSPLSRVLASFFVAVGEHRVPTRMFTNEQAARAWLGASP